MKQREPYIWFWSSKIENLLRKVGNPPLNWGRREN